MKLFFLAVISTLFIGISSAQSGQGLTYKYYEGSWSTLPDFNSLSPVSSGTATSINLDQRKRDQQYAFLYQGYITIPATGNYTFDLLSDDGSRLYIGNYSYTATPVVDNDGLHTSQVRSGSIALNAGVYPIALTYMQGTGSQIWQVTWSSNTGISGQKLPDNVLSTTNGTTTTPTGTSGLNYSYYEGSWSSVPDFSTLSAVKTGTSTNFSITPRNKDNQYAFLWQGYVTIATTGNYTFETNSDDGSKLYVGGTYSSTATALVNNDGLHSSQSKTGSVALTAGIYPITVAFFQQGGSQNCDVYWSSNTGISRQPIPDNVLSTTSSSGGGGGSSSGGLNYNYYEGTWSTLPDFSSLTPAKSGTSANIDLTPRNRNINYAFVWQGNVNVPASGTYTFETVSDDGSKVYLNGSSVALVNNDGLHASQSKTGAIALNAGLNPITITYFQQGGGQVMELYWSSSNGLARQRIPDNALTPSTITPPIAEAPPAVVTPVAPVGVVTPTNTSGSGGLTGNNNYYFSSTNGDDSRSSTQAKNSSTPWKTISKLNSVMSTLQSGDAVLFNRGDVFDGGINMTTSGITFSSYGSGLKPVINGFSQVTNWTSLGNGIWQASCNSSDRVNNVIMNGVSQQLGRYPNITDPNKGYLSLESHAGTYLITDNQLSGSPNWTGAEVVIRKQHWVLDRCLITNHSGNNIYYNSPTAHEPNDGYGYFIQNSPLTLDQLGEWYFDPSQKVLKMYFGSNNPNSYDIRASTVNNLATIAGRSNILIDNLFFQGADDYGIKIDNSQTIHVQNCNIDLSGTNAVTAQTVSSFTFENSSITNTNNNALQCNAVSNTSIRNNTVQNTGLRPGMGQSANQQYNGIYTEGSGNTVELNNVLNTGLSGITFAGDNLSVKNNYVNTFCLTVDDGGGIYGWGDLTKFNRKIVGNIVMNGIGAFEGTTDTGPTGSSGIYHDDESANVDMTDNSVANCSRSGIFIHNSHEMLMRNNTVFNSQTQLSMVHDPISILNPIRNVTLDNNILFSKKASQFVMEMSSTTNDLTSFGSFTNNYYDRPIDDNGIINTLYKDNSGTYQYNFYDVNGWKTAFPAYDQYSKGSPMKIPSYKITSFNGGNRYSNSTFSSNTGNVYCLSSPGKCAVSWNSGGRLDGGALQVTFDGGNGAVNPVGLYTDIGPTTAGKTYQIKFSIVGGNAGKTIKAFLLDGTTYARLSDTKYFSVSNSRSENDFLYIASASASATILTFEIAGPDIPYWLDNLQVYDVNTNFTNPDDYIKFVYNPTSSATSVSLGGNYVDARNNFYSGSINLAPYTSAVLINQAANQIADDATAPQREAATIATQSVQQDAAESKALSVSVSPNPARDNVQITVNAPQGTQKSSITINSISGATMKVIPVVSSNQRLTLDVSTWSTGVYIINYNCDGHVIYKKFVKQ
jgi:hypothetical protein